MGLHSLKYKSNYRKLSTYSQPSYYGLKSGLREEVGLHSLKYKSIRDNYQPIASHLIIVKKWSEGRGGSSLTEI